MDSLDEGNIFYSDQRRDDQRQDDSSPTVLAMHYKEFVRTFRVDEVHVYRQQLRQAISLRQYVLEVDIDHLMEYNDSLTNELLQRPSHHLPIFEKAVLEAAVSMAIIDANEAVDMPDLQVTLTSSKQPISIRQLLSSQVARVVMIPGIVISASRVKAKATQISARCKGCQSLKQIPVRSGFAGASLPRKCDQPRQPGEAACPLDPYQIIPDKCAYVDQQTWRLQESPEMVPTGEMPRSVMLAADRHLVDRAVPGSRVTVTGIMSIMNQQGRRGNSSIRTPYLQVLGVKNGFEHKTSAGHSLTSFTQAEEEYFRELAREPNVYERICKSIAPAIYGSEEVKKAVACLLFGGSRKELDDGARLRGDINLLLLGDPSVAKSQFLKFVDKVAPIALYTSGKGSSAAGLTATVIKDSNREFYLEGGAMVLADGGVVCIDEFDKMREQDRVAIHEAMEQQTISIAKAGITTVLNSRTSVFAAANPVFGRYDDDKNAAEQVDFQATILSRFDMIFILRDLYDVEKDMTLAKHIIDIHVQGGATTAREPPEDELSIDILKRYIAYARLKCAPRLNADAIATLENYYVSVRQNLHRSDAEDEEKGRAPRAVPITVRQLEAIVRISESIARMRLSDVATEDDVQLAIHLFSVSTLEAAKMNDLDMEGGGGDHEQVRSCEEAIRSRIAIGARSSKAHLVRDLISVGYDERAVLRAMHALIKQGVLEQMQQGKQLRRARS
ncbi:hypothetical protein AB1Y20_007167 [Prymnesium parvum]|uniref:DNA replication licensing factor MCM5 n=1 Tax=Prymnesium parvum TaxID=97485 RepID=A0AB34IWL6_PRYPA